MAKRPMTDGEPDGDAPGMGKKRGGMITDGEPDMDAPGIERMMKHKEMPSKAKHGHKPMPFGAKHGHGPMHKQKKPRGA